MEARILNNPVTQIQVKGIAVKQGKSKNNIVYTEKALCETAEELADKPILKDHKAITDNTIGRTISARYENGAVLYEGWVKEDGTGVIQKILDGRIKEVSIGAMVEKLVQESDDDESLIAEGIHYVELSTTPTPGVAGTSILPSSQSVYHEKINSFELVEHKPEICTEHEKKSKEYKQEALANNKKVVLEENTMSEASETISVDEYQKVKKELEETKIRIKEGLVSEILAVNPSLNKIDLLKKEINELQLMKKYETELATAKNAVAEVKPKAEVKEVAKVQEDFVHLSGPTERKISARAGQVVIERQGQGKINFFKMPDYSRMGWKGGR